MIDLEVDAQVRRPTAIRVSDQEPRGVVPLFVGTMYKITGGQNERGNQAIGIILNPGVAPLCPSGTKVFETKEGKRAIGLIMSSSVPPEFFGEIIDETMSIEEILEAAKRGAEAAKAPWLFEKRKARKQLEAARKNNGRLFDLSVISRPQLQREPQNSAITPLENLTNPV